MKVTVTSCSISQETSKKTMQHFYRKLNYILDPHTAVAASAVISKNLRDGDSYVCLATAAPYKFSDTINSVLGISLSLPLPYDKYEDQMKHGENWEQILRNRIIQISKQTNIQSKL